LNGSVDELMKEMESPQKISFQLLRTPIHFQRQILTLISSQFHPLQAHAFVLVVTGKYKIPVDAVREYVPLQQRGGKLHRLPAARPHEYGFGRPPIVFEKLFRRQLQME
jgi:hypothetical protein